MIEIAFSRKRGRTSKEGPLFTAKFGNSEIVDVRAKNEFEAEEKLLFVLMHELRGKIIDFDIGSIK